MRDTARAAWRSYSDPLEGVCLFPYVDIRNLVTTATGVLIDPVDSALRLAWVIGDRPATEAEVRTEFDALKNHPDAHRWIAANQAKLTRIRLTEESADRLVTQRLNANVAYLQKLFPLWNDLPADAHISEVKNAGVVPRNRQQELCFDNALTVTERGLDPNWLWWPNRCPKDETLHEAAIKALGLVK